jgi:hypothetical protein
VRVIVRTRPGNTGTNPAVVAVEFASRSWRGESNCPKIRPFPISVRDRPIAQEGQCQHPRVSELTIGRIFHRGRFCKHLVLLFFLDWLGQSVPNSGLEVSKPSGCLRDGLSARRTSSQTRARSQLAASIRTTNLKNLENEPTLVFALLKHPVFALLKHRAESQLRPAVCPTGSPTAN